MDIGKRNVSSVYGVKSELNIWIDVLRSRKQSVQSHIILSILFMYIHLYVEYSSGPLSTAIEKDTKVLLVGSNSARAAFRDEVRYENPRLPLGS